MNRAADKKATKRPMGLSRKHNAHAKRAQNKASRATANRASYDEFFNSLSVAQRRQAR